MKKIILLPLITLSIVFLMSTVNLGAFMVANETGGAYSGVSAGLHDQSKQGNNNDASPTIAELITQGGSFFFQSSSGMNLFFKNFELSGISGPEFKSLQKTLNTAIYYMEKARDTYLQLKNLASVTPYNQEVLSKIIAFDYDAFQQEKGLMFPLIFEKVKRFLGSGDVTGVYNDLYNHTGKILDLLLLLKQDVDAEVFPSLSIVWSANLKYAEMRLFGQYVAEVFYSIK